jgi:hypothetical protein
MLQGQVLMPQAPAKGGRHTFTRTKEINHASQIALLYTLRTKIGCYNIIKVYCDSKFQQINSTNVYYHKQ